MDTKQFLEELPSASEILAQLSQNERDSKMLRQMLRIVLQREKNAKECSGDASKA